MRKTKTTTGNTTDVTKRDVVVLIAMFAILVALYFFIPWALKGIADVGKFVTHTIASLAVVVSGYAAISSYRLKAADNRRAYDAAVGTIISDTTEIIEQATVFSKRFEVADNHGDWNDALRDFEMVEKRFNRKQDALPFMANQFPPSTFSSIHILYLEMYRLAMRSSKYLVVTAQDYNPDAVKQQIKSQRKDLLQRMNGNVSDIRAKYKELQKSIEALKPLSKDLET